MNKFQVGDVVRILPRDPNKEYRLPYLNSMARHAGEVYEISYTTGDGRYALNGTMFYWSEDMLELYVSNEDPTLIL